MRHLYHFRLPREKTDFLRYQFPIELDNKTCQINDEKSLKLIENTVQKNGGRLLKMQFFFVLKSIMQLVFRKLPKNYACLFRKRKSAFDFKTQEFISERIFLIHFWNPLPTTFLQHQSPIFAENYKIHTFKHRLLIFYLLQLFEIVIL